MFFKIKGNKLHIIKDNKKTTQKYKADGISKVALIQIKL